MASRRVRQEGRRISHVVFMGMGEPLDNYAAAVKATNLLIGEDAFGLSNRHVTISTSGIAPKIVELARDSRASLAVSLHAANDTLRSELMPINRKYSLSELKDAIKAWQKATLKKITIEYILIAGKNCDQQHANELVRFLSGLKAKVNLIPFNAHPGLPYERPGAEEIRAFQTYLASRSIPAPVRYSLGLDVSAACGQLAAKKAPELALAPERRRALHVPAVHSSN
jgi:23S rRNA (adenine2503-C2)-methyltransferase